MTKFAKERAARVKGLKARLAALRARMHTKMTKAQRAINAAKRKALRAKIAKEAASARNGMNKVLGDEKKGYKEKALKRQAKETLKHFRAREIAANKAEQLRLAKKLKRKAHETLKHFRARQALRKERRAAARA